MKSSSNSTDRKEEFRKGIKRTSRFLISHHVPTDYNRCYKLNILGKKLRVCSRCIGIWTGIISGIIYKGAPDTVLFIAISPMPTLIEKYLTDVKNRNGYNLLRTFTGLMLGLGYIQAFKLITTDPIRPLIFLIGFSYLLAALVLLKFEDAFKSKNSSN